MINVKFLKTGHQLSEIDLLYVFKKLFFCKIKFSDVKIGH